MVARAQPGSWPGPASHYRGGRDWTLNVARVSGAHRGSVDSCSRIGSRAGQGHQEMADFSTRPRRRWAHDFATRRLAGASGPTAGRVPEVPMAPIEELEAAYLAAREDPACQSELAGLLPQLRGAAHAALLREKLSETLGGARIWLKREDLLHTGAHRSTTAWAGAARARMGKRRIIAETAPDSTGSHRHSLRPARLRCGLYGRRRTCGANASTSSHAHARRGCVPNSATLKDDQRSHARLGHQCRRRITCSAARSARILTR